MGTITLQNFRVTADVTMNTRLKDGGVYIDWAGLSNIKAWLYSDAQKAMAGRCVVSINQADSTKLVCEYSATKPQYLGVQRLVIQAKYHGRTKTFDKVVFNFVPRTADQEGTEIVMDDPVVDVEIEVQDVTSSILDNILAACIKATEEAREVVDVHRGPAGVGFESLEQTEESDESGGTNIWTARLTDGTTHEFQVKNGQAGSGLDSVEQTTTSHEDEGVNVITFTMKDGTEQTAEIRNGSKGSKGDKGDQGNKGDKGDQGNTGSSVDYPYELVNNRKTDDATKGLSAAEGKRLGDDLDRINTQEIDQSVYELRDYSIKADGTYGTSASYKHMVIPVSEGEKYLIEATGTSGVRYAFFSSLNAPVSGGDMPLVPDTSVEEMTYGDKVFVTIPTGCAGVAFYYGQTPYNWKPDFYKVYSIVETNEAVAEFAEDVEDVDLFINGKNETVYENTGEIAYYETNGGNNLQAGVGSVTKLFSEAITFNTIITPQIRAGSTSGAIKYIVLDSETTEVSNPSSQATIQEGVIQISDTYQQYTITLNEPYTLPAGHCVAVLFYENSADLDDRMRLRGGTSGVTIYNSDSHKFVYLQTRELEDPWSQTWSLGAVTYIGPAPILRFVQAAGIEDSVLDAIANNKEQIAEELSPYISEDVIPQIEEQVAGIAEDVVAEKAAVNVYLADRYYAVVGDTIQLFFQGIVGVVNIDNYNIIARCPVGHSYRRYWELTPTNSNVGSKTMTIYVYDKDGNELGRASTTIVIVSAPVSPLTRKNIFTIGDSLTSGGQWPMETARRLLNTNTYDGIKGDGLSNIVFCGTLSITQRAQSVNYYGRGGWTWAKYENPATPEFRFEVTDVGNVNIGDIYSNNGHNYTIVEINITSGEGNILCSASSSSDTPEASGTLTRVSGDGDATVTFTGNAAENSNPLWDSVNNKFSFIPYVTACGETTIDVMCVLLTWNSTGAWKNYSVDDQTGHIADAKKFARTLHSEYPSAKLKIIGLQMPSINGGTGADYSGSSSYLDCIGLCHTAFSYNQALQALCNDAEFSSFCEFIDIAPQFDSLYNMQVSIRQVNTRYTDGPTERIGTNGLHPAARGYYQIADAVYRNIVANYCQSE